MIRLALIAHEGLSENLKIYHSLYQFSLSVKDFAPLRLDEIVFSQEAMAGYASFDL